ncbi:MAG: DUF6179 domain-containing protein [Bacillota bacterium]|nr:DUF6179 domain-containing protein [Bacillota bacterium]
MKWQSEKYNGLDSTSLTIEKAQELLESLLYTISMVAAVDNVAMDEIFQKDLPSVIRRGQEILIEKRKSVKVEWELMWRDMPRIQNAYFFETLKNLGLFFKRYEIYYEAHQIPCSIDYWLLCPISDQVKGISFIEEYIHRIQIENDFLKQFDINLLVNLYKSSIPDYEETLFNLCDPALTNAIGLTLLGQDARTLDITCEQRKKIVSSLTEKSIEEIDLLIKNAVSCICAELNMIDECEKTYLRNAVSGLSARIETAVRHGDLSHVFISFLPKDMEIQRYE